MGLRGGLPHGLVIDPIGVILVLSGRRHVLFFRFLRQRLGGLVLERRHEAVGELVLVGADGGVDAAGGAAARLSDVAVLGVHSLDKGVRQVTRDVADPVERRGGLAARLRVGVLVADDRRKRGLDRGVLVDFRGDVVADVVGHLPHLFRFILQLLDHRPGIGGPGLPFAAIDGNGHVAIEVGRPQVERRGLVVLLENLLEGEGGAGAHRGVRVVEFLDDGRDAGLVDHFADVAGRIVADHLVLVAQAADESGDGILVRSGGFDLFGGRVLDLLELRGDAGGLDAPGVELRVELLEVKVHSLAGGLLFGPRAVLGVVAILVGAVLPLAERLGDVLGLQLLVADRRSSRRPRADLLVSLLLGERDGLGVFLQGHLEIDRRLRLRPEAVVEKGRGVLAAVGIFLGVREGRERRQRRQQECPLHGVLRQMNPQSSRDQTKIIKGPPGTVH